MLLLSLFLCSLVATDSVPDLAEARARARSALGLSDWAADRRTIREGTSRLFGREVPWSTSADAEGRFLTTFGGALPRNIGFDGREVWMQHADRTVRELALGERSDELLAAWILSGFWTLERCPIQFKEPVLDEDDPADGQLHIPFRFEDPAAGSVDPVRGVIRLDRERFFVTEALWQRGGQVRGIGLQAEGAAVNERELRYSARLGELTEPLMVARQVRTVEAADGGFGRPEPPGGARFDPEAPAQLEVARVATGHLLVQALVDGESAWFFLDTGAGMNMLDRGLAASLEPELLGEVGVAGVGGDVPSSVGRFESLELGPMVLDGPVFVTLDLAGVGGMLGHEVAGILGYDVFARCVVAFDVSESSIAVHEAAGFEPPEGTTWERLVLFERHPAVRARVEGHEALLRVDTGASDVLDLEGPAIERWNLLEGRETRTSRSGGIGGEIETLAGRLDSLELGGHRFEEIPVGFVQTTSGFHGSGALDGNLGLGALEPFVVFFDYERGRIGFLPEAR